MVENLSPGDIWVILSLVMIPIELWTKTTFAIALGISFGFTGVIALISFGMVPVFGQFLLFAGLTALIQVGAVFLRKQRCRAQQASQGEKI